MRLRASILVIVPFMLVRSPQASADDTAPSPSALERFREGSRLYGAGEYAAARAAFEEVYRIRPEPRVLANIATCFVAESRPAEAVRTFRRFLHDATSVPASARRSAEREIARLRPGLGDLVIAADPPGSEILIDATPVGTAPLPWPVAVEPGTRSIEVRAAGHTPVARAIEIRAGEETSLSLVLQRVPQSAPQAPEPPAPLEAAPAAAPIAGESAPPPARVPPPAAGLRSPTHRSATPLGRGPLLWTGLGLTGALAAAATVTGLLSLSALGEYEDPSTQPDRRPDLFDQANLLADVTDVLVWTAVGAAVATAALFLLAGPEDGPRDQMVAVTAEGGWRWRAALSF